VAARPLLGLSLCSGVGGLELGLRLALGPLHRTVCYVEREAHAAAVLAARMGEGALDKAPVWDDLGTFDGRPWRGVVDLVSCGFSCQPWSAAGKRLGEQDPRWTWPDVARVVDECRAGIVFLENVQLKAFRTPLDDLRGMGFVVRRPCRAAAASVGAGHLRRRFFLLASRPDSDAEGRLREAAAGQARLQGGDRPRHDAQEGAVHPDSDRDGRGPRRPQERDVDRPRRRQEARERAELVGVGTDPDEPGLEGQDQRAPQPRDAARPDWWGSEPRLDRMADGVPCRVDRLREVGNACVPVVAALAFRTLAADLLR